MSLRSSTLRGVRVNCVQWGRRLLDESLCSEQGIFEVGVPVGMAGKHTRETRARRPGAAGAVAFCRDQRKWAMRGESHSGSQG
eukprot:1105093-Prymnesium_polylepis.1